jgi:hypothetical protein
MRPLFRVVFVPSAPMNEDKAGDCGVFENDLGELLLLVRHGREGDGLGRLGNALKDAGVLGGKESLGDLNVLVDRQNASNAAATSSVIVSYWSTHLRLRP